MSSRIGLLLSTLIGTCVTGAYWLSLFALAYGLTAGDYRPGSTGEPSDLQRHLIAWAIWGAGFMIYLALAWLWRKVDFAIAKRTIA